MLKVQIVRVFHKEVRVIFSPDWKETILVEKIQNNKSRDRITVLHRIKAFHSEPRDNIEQAFNAQLEHCQLAKRAIKTAQLVLVYYFIVVDKNVPISGCNKKSTVKSPCWERVMFDSIAYNYNTVSIIHICVHGVRCLIS